MASTDTGLWKKSELLILLLITIFIELCTCNRLCYSCTNIPHPRDCGRIVECGPSQICFVEQVITDSGNVYYNSGCNAPSRCPPTGRRSVSNSSYNVTYSNGIGGNDVSGNDIIKADSNKRDIEVCYQCCDNHDFCNGNLCEKPGTDTSKGVTCLNCPDVLSPEKCEFVLDCLETEMCYTEKIFINNEIRYRLGCISKTACAPASTTLIGRKRFILDDQYCASCCSDPYGNCNRGICDPTGKAPPSTTIELVLVTPPVRTDYCEDVTPLSCSILGIQNNKFCHDATVKNYACRAFCGTCVNTGKTPSPTGMTTADPRLDKKNCFFDSRVYEGTTHVSTTGSRCLPWSDYVRILPEIASGLPDLSAAVAGNNCRDPDGKGHPWCFVAVTQTADDGWEYCDVPYCPECYYGNGSTYNGHVSVTANNETCQAWTEAKVSIPDTEFVDGSQLAAMNYCRAITTSGGVKTIGCIHGSVVETCDIKQCEDPCEDDIHTGCAALEGVICKNQFYSLSLCPKTCKQCGVGLSRAKFIAPPKSACSDQPSGNCEVLKNIICADPTTAERFCPRTCGLCNAGGTVSSTTMKMTTPTPIPIATTPIPIATSPITTATAPVWTAWGSEVCSSVDGSCLTTRYRNCSTHTNTDCSGTFYEFGSCTPTKCPVWTAWGSEVCSSLDGSCLTIRYRNCSTNTNTDCSGKFYEFGSCTPTKCPGYSTPAPTVTTTTPRPTPTECVDKPGFCTADSVDVICADPVAAVQLCPVACKLCVSTQSTTLGPITLAPATTCMDKAVQCGDNPSDPVRIAFCSDPSLAASMCAKSCGICKVECRDSSSLNCSSQQVKKFFCADEALAVNFCRKTCDKCNAPWRNVTYNTCGDPVATETTCAFLHSEICLCKDVELNGVLCPNYCNNRCGTVGDCTLPHGRRSVELIDAAYAAADYIRKRK